ncbi:MAG: cytochrome c oxidase subunit II [Chloroflexi bacterium]|nr:cytochrome c oxidase subunit II [Chloroflexota bacterium]
MGNKRHLVNVSVLVVVASVLVYFGLSAFYQLPKKASTEAVIIDNMFNVYFGLIAFFFTLIMVFMLYSVFVFRRKPGDTEDAAHIHGHTGLEIAWTLIPVIIVVTLAIWGTMTFNELVSAKDGEMVIEVVGQQWSWSFAYPEQEDISSAELVLPVNQPVVLEMESTDVIHSFWVPEFRVKQDLVPGQMTTLRFEPTEIGDYKVRCAEICGFDHTKMVADVQVVSEADFAAWVEDAQADPIYADMAPEDRGAIWYSSGAGFACQGCHSLDGTVGAGPSWQGVYGITETLADGSSVTVDDEYIRDSILEPDSQIVEGFSDGLMSGGGNTDYGARFAEREAEILAGQGTEIDIIEDLIAFIKTLEE